jgi:hypothetical protein
MSGPINKLFWLAVFSALSAAAQQSAVTPTAREQETPAGDRRIYYGFRVEAFPLKLFETGSATSSTTKPIADYTYSSNNSSQKAAPGAAVNYRLTRRLSVNGEFFLHHAKYMQTTTIRTGKQNTNSSTDDRPVTTEIETTRANYWVIPVQLQYTRIPKLKGNLYTRMFSHAYFSGGIEYRHVGRVRTGTDIENADGTTDYSEIATKPAHGNQFGAVLAIGLRFIDEMGIRVTPEIRVIRWQGSTFQGPGYRSATNQAEFGLGFAF